VKSVEVRKGGEEERRKAFQKRVEQDMKRSLCQDQYFSDVIVA
jgi:hypothetical protein